jgi:hypothetical protein
VLKILHTGSDFNRAEMLKEFQNDWWEQSTAAARAADNARGRKWPYEYNDSYGDNITPDPKLVISYFPEFLRVARTESDNEVRLAAVELLASISGNPADANDQSPRADDIATLLPQWEAWYVRNGAPARKAGD